MSFRRLISPPPPFILGYAKHIQGGAAVTTPQLWPLWVPTQTPLKRLNYNVSVQDGNIDIGIYTSSFVRVWSSGSFVCPAPGPRSVSITPPLALPPGLYYVAWNANSSLTQLYVNINACGQTGFTANAVHPLPAVLTGLIANSGLGLLFTVDAF